jgi:hypothetical protein
VFRFAVGIEAEKSDIDDVASDPNDQFTINVKSRLTTEASLTDVVESLRTMMCMQISCVLPPFLNPDNPLVFQRLTGASSSLARTVECVHLTELLFNAHVPKGTLEKFANTVRERYTPSRSRTLSADCRQVDAVFVLDMSSSVGQENWNINIIPFINQLVDHFEVGPDNAQFGMASFSRTGTLHWGLSQYSTAAAFINAANGIKYTGVSILSLKRLI